MTETAEPAPDVDALVEELQARVAQRFDSGEYPPDLERELRAHFEDLARSRRMPDRFAELMRRVDDAAGFSQHRIQLISSMPGGRRLHGLIAAAVRRQVTGILAQDRLFAVAVRDVLTEVIRSLPERAPDDAWWDVPAAYLEELYGPVEGVLADLAPLAEALAGSAPVLVLETGRGELASAAAARGADARTAEREPMAELEALRDGSLGGLGVRRLLERLPAPALPRFTELAARKLRAQGRLGVALRNPLAAPDPALSHRVDPRFLAYLLADAGFGSIEVRRARDAELVLATR